MLRIFYGEIGWHGYHRDPYYPETFFLIIINVMNRDCTYILVLNNINSFSPYLFIFFLLLLPVMIFYISYISNIKVAHLILDNTTSLPTFIVNITILQND